jgi:hypothetical protein
MADSNNQGGANHQQGEGTRATHNRNDVHVYNMTRCDIEAYIVEADQNENGRFHAVELEKPQGTTNMAAHDYIYGGTWYHLELGRQWKIIVFYTFCVKVKGSHFTH